jgi:magnesium and cobalt exporter, CNNM family
MITVVIPIILVSLLLMLFLSVVESAAAFFSGVNLKVLIEKYGMDLRLLRTMGADNSAFLLTLQLGIQVLLVLISSLLTFLLVFWYGIQGFALSLALLFLMVILFRQIIPRILIKGKQERLLLKLLPVLGYVYPLLRLLSGPILLCLQKVKAAPDLFENETSEEEIQAYLDVGEDAGIFERGESDLIQSALEFSGTVVKDIMTSRSEMVTVEDKATMSELRDVMVHSRHSRIPILKQHEDRFIGIVYMKTFLGMLENGFEDRNIALLISEVMFVPETKKVSVLLKEMQTNAEHMAMVVNEYGTVSGLVTIEDLLEEIVGDIRDEDEDFQEELVREGDGIYFARGTLEIKQLEDALDTGFSDFSASTVSGMVVEYLGRIPSTGENLNLDGYKFEVIHADSKRVHTLRILSEVHRG